MRVFLSVCYLNQTNVTKHKMNKKINQDFEIKTIRFRLTSECV